MKITNYHIKKGITILRCGINDFAFKVGLLKYSTLNPDKKTILIYHGVDLDDNRTFNSKFVSKERIYNQFKWLKENTNIVSLTDYFENNNQSKKHTIAITFDDGFYNNYELLFPIIQELQIQVTIFATTIQLQGYDILWPDYLDLASSLAPEKITIEGKVYHKKKGVFFNEQSQSLKQQMRFSTSEEKIKILNGLKMYSDFMKDKKLDLYWKLMNESQLKEISNSPFVTIGAHGSWHNNLSEISEQDAIQELEESKKYLEKVIGKEIIHLAYPDGSYTRSLINKAEKLGYRYQLAADYLFKEDNADKRIENRIGLNPYTSWFNQVLVLKKGHY